MSYTGKSPKLKRVRYIPQSTDPISPIEGDLFYSDGTPRAEGLWYYKNGAWQVVIADNATITQLTMDKLNLAPLSADPIAPPQGEIFFSDGTTREAGLWFYTGTAWAQISRSRAQEFYYNKIGTVRVSTTVNITIATALNSGDTLNGLVLVNGDRVLVKDQTVTSENGVYVVSASPQRAVDYDTAAEVTKASVYVSLGTVNSRTLWFQNSTITTLGADSQSWSTSMTSQTFTVPADVFELELYGAGGGGGGGSGGGRSAGLTFGGSGGAGGNGSFLTGPWPIKVTPGSTLTISLGAGGSGAAKGVDGVAGSVGSTGGNTTVSGGTDGYVISFTGAFGGNPGTIGGTGAGATGNPGGTGGTTTAVGFNFQKMNGSGTGGFGGNASSGAGSGTGGGAGQSTMFGAGGALGGQTPSNSNRAGAGGGGGGGYNGAGGAGGSAVPNATPASEGTAGIGYGAGGGGGAGSDGTVSQGATAGGHGANGYVRIVW